MAGAKKRSVHSKTFYILSATANLASWTGAATSAAWRSAEPNNSASSRTPAIRPSTGCSRMKAGIRMCAAPSRMENSDRRPAPERARKSADDQQDQEHHQQQLGDQRSQACQPEKTHISRDQCENQKSQRPTEHAVCSQKSRSQKRRDQAPGSHLSTGRTGVGAV